MITFYRSLVIFFQIIEFFLVVRIIMSFMNINPNNALGRIVYELTNPILAPAKGILNMLKLNTGMLDFSPILAMFILRGILKLVFNLVY